MSTTVILTKAIKGVGGIETFELSFREPTGADLVAAGYPWRLVNNLRSGETVRTIDTGAVTTMIARLAGVPPSSVMEMNIFDWSVCMGEVATFLADPASKPSSTPTSASANTSTTSAT